MKFYFFLTLVFNFLAFQDYSYASVVGDEDEGRFGSSSVLRPSGNPGSKNRLATDKENLGILGNSSGDSFKTPPRHKRKHGETKVSPATENEFRKAGIRTPELHAFKTLNTAFLDKGESPLSAEEIVAYEEKGGKGEQLRSAWSALKQAYPGALCNPEVLEKKYFTPPARRAGIPRKIIKALKEKEVIWSLAADYAQPPEPVETEEEKEKRRSFMRQRFKAAELQRGITATHAQEALSWEEKVWGQQFFPYMDARRKEIEEHHAPKIRRTEIEDAFSMFIVQKGHYECFVLDNYTIYYNPALIDLDRRDAEGQLNLQRLLDKKCPLGPDGKEMNFHHLTHYDPGPLVLLTYHFHATQAKLHFRSHKIFSFPQNAIDRNAFAFARKGFCLKLASLLSSPLSTSNGSNLGELQEELQ